jgi:glycosyltransferase involved in cell wall biosynthesis
VRIAYLCADFGIPIRGYKGASVHVRELVAALVALGHDVRIFSPNPGEGNSVVAPLHVIGSEGLLDSASRLIRMAAGGRYPRLDKEMREIAYNLTLYREIRAHLHTWRPDVVYERYSLFNLAGLALARRLGVPHILEVNAPLRLERARTKGLTMDRMAGLVERRLFRGSDAVLVVTGALRRYVKDQSGGAAHTTVLPNGVDTRRFTPWGSYLEARARLGLAPAAFVVGFAGSLKPWHGVDVLIEAFAALRAREPAARLLIVGEGPQENALRGRVAGLGLEGAVAFTGRVPHDAMPGYLAAMDVAVAPYLPVPDFYFSPLKLYEYMAAGLAVVASAAGEITSLVRDGQTGLLCPPGDAAALSGALSRMASDPALRIRLGAAAREEAARHTWEENARAVVGLAAALRLRRSQRPLARDELVREGA